MVAEDLNDIRRREGPGAIRAMLDEVVLRQRQKMNGSEEEKPRGGATFNGHDHGDETEPEEPFTWEDVPEDGFGRKPEKEKSRPRFTSFSIDDIEEPCLEVFFLIHGLMIKHGVQITYGPSSVGKTFAKLHALLHVATGRKYNGRRTEKALVVYVTGEGERMFRNRIYLAKKKLGIKKGGAAFRGITDMPGLARNDVDAKELVKAVKAIAAETQYAGLPVVVVIDTASTALKGAKEDEVGLGLLMSNSKLIANELDGLTIVIHHTGKDVTAGPRGSYVLIGNSDVVWRIEDLEGSECGGMITIEKMRDGPKDVFWTFERKAVLIGKNEYGDEITTCHIELTSEPKFQKKKAEGKRGDGEVAFDDAFNEVTHAHGFEYLVGGDPRVKVRAVALTHVRKEFGCRYAIGKDGEERGRTAISTAFTRALKASIRRYRTRAVTIESDADVTRYGLTKNQVAKPKDGSLYEVEIIWSIKHEPKPLGTGVADEEEEE